MNDEEKTEPSQPDEVPTKPNGAVHVSNCIPDFTAPLRETSKRISEQVSLVGKQFEQVNKLVGDFWKDIGKKVQKAFENIPRYLILMATEYGWPPIWGWGPYEYNHLMARAESIDSLEERREYVTREIVKYFDGEELDHFLARWKAMSFLQGTDRLAIIEDAFEAHKNMKYSLSCPAILAQTEGLFSQWILKSEKTVEKKDYNEQWTDALEEHGDKFIVVTFNEALYKFVDKCGLYGFRDEGKEEYDKALAFPISRHKILHGSSTDYRNRIDVSLRHLLWLDAVIQMIDDRIRKDEAEVDER
jgi:hypothetical protein